MTPNEILVTGNCLPRLQPYPFLFFGVALLVLIWVPRLVYTFPYLKEASGIESSKELAPISKTWRLVYCYPTAVCCFCFMIIWGSVCFRDTWFLIVLILLTIWIALVYFINAEVSPEYREYKERRRRAPDPSKVLPPPGLDLAEQEYLESLSNYHGYLANLLFIGLEVLDCLTVSYYYTIDTTLPTGITGIVLLTLDSLFFFVLIVLAAARSVPRLFNRETGKYRPLESAYRFNPWPTVTSVFEYSFATNSIFTLLFAPAVAVTSYSP